jgi:hypothetical protein
MTDESKDYLVEYECSEQEEQDKYLEIVEGVYQNIKEILHDSFYGCFLNDMTFSKFVDYIENEKSLPPLSLKSQDKKNDEFLQAHYKIFYRLFLIFKRKFEKNIDSFIEFVLDCTSKECLCVELEKLEQF